MTVSRCRWWYQVSQRYVDAQVDLYWTRRGKVTLEGRGTSTSLHRLK